MNRLGVPLLKSDGTIGDGVALTSTSHPRGPGVGRGHRLSAATLEAPDAFVDFISAVRDHCGWGVAHRVLLHFEARKEPLWRLRYRWSLRRRAPAWKRRAVRDTRAVKALMASFDRAAADRHAADILNNGFTV